MGSVLVDSSAWISFFRPGSEEISQEVDRLLAEDRAVLVGPVLAELLCGVRGGRELRVIEELATAVEFQETIRLDWEAAGQELRELRSQGITVPLTDAVIAAMARRIGCPILTLDRHFEHLSNPGNPIAR